MRFKISDGALHGYTGSDPIVVIPEGVTKIATFDFKGRNEIAEIILPESLIEVWSYVFAECKGLEKVSVLGDTVLKAGAFYKCENLKELNVTRGIKGIGSGAFLGCPKLESNELSDKKFELYTLIGDRSLSEISYIKDTDITKELYSWEEYKRITSETLAYALMFLEDYCNELEGVDPPEKTERNTPLLDEMIVVKDGHFVGCALKEEYIFHIKNKSEGQKPLVLLKPGDKPIRIRSVTAEHLPFYSHLYVDAFFRRSDDPKGCSDRRLT